MTNYYLKKMIHPREYQGGPQQRQVTVRRLCHRREKRL